MQVKLELNSNTGSGNKYFFYLKKSKHWYLMYNTQLCEYEFRTNKMQSNSTVQQREKPSAWQNAFVFLDRIKTNMDSFMSLSLLCVMSVHEHITLFNM